MELICIFPLACALYIWHDTDTFVEYMSLFGLGNFFGIKKFKEERELNPMMDYESYLLINHNSFLIRLITCPICLSVWLNLLAFAVHHRNVEMFFVSLWLPWLAYFSIKLIITKADGN